MKRFMITRALLRGACAFLLAGAGLAAPAAAGTLQIDPVKLEIGTKRKTASLTVRNEEDAPVTIRVHALVWRQDGGNDLYEESAAIIVSPPIFTIAARGSQTVRVGLRTPEAAGRAYRLIVEEVPEADPAAGIRVALRLDIPLFAGLEAGAPAELAWTLWQDKGGGWIAEAANAGQTYVRVEPEMLGAATGLRPAGITFGTVLPGSRRRWSLGPKPQIADPVRFQSLVRTDDAASPTATN